MRKIKVTKPFIDLGLSDMSGPIDVIIDQLEVIRDNATTEGYSEITVIQNYDGIDGVTGFQIVGDRLETDKELAARAKKISKEKAKKQKDEEFEKEELKRLIKKYGPVDADGSFDLDASLDLEVKE